MRVCMKYYVYLYVTTYVCACLCKYVYVYGRTYVCIQALSLSLEYVIVAAAQIYLRVISFSKTADQTKYLCRIRKL